MKNKILIIEPYNFIGPHMSPGHKKDMYLYKKQFIKKNIIVKNLYVKGLSIYNKNKDKQDFNLFDLANFKVMEDYEIIFSPYYSLRYIPFIFRNRKVHFYVCDSLFKTSMHGFYKNFLLFHRLIYALFSELLLKKHSIITVSIDEYLWFSSSGFQISNLYMIPPIPLKSDSSSFHSTEKNIIDNQKYILFYNPNGDGIKIAERIINGLQESIVENTNIIVTGKSSNKLNIKSNKLKLIKFQYVEDIESMIYNSKLVVLTDIGGTGFNNRASQIRSLLTPLLCTVDSLRGTPLMYDENVYIFDNSKQASEFINNSIDEVHHSESPFELKHFELYEKQLNNFLDNILGR